MKIEDTQQLNTLLRTFVKTMREEFKTNSISDVDVTFIDVTSIGDKVIEHKVSFNCRLEVDLSL